MGIIQVVEGLDPGLEITQLIESEKSSSELPSHDRLYLEKAEETKDAQEKKKEEAPPSEDAPAEPTADDQSEDEAEAKDENTEGEANASGEESPDAEPEVINGKQTTVATESLRTEDYYTSFALENYGEETLLQKTGSLAWSGVKAVSGFALHVATELGGYMKDLGIEYGPKIYAKLRSGVSYLITRLFKSYGKMRSAVAKAYFQNVHSFKKHSTRLQRLRQILQELPAMLS